MKDNPVSLARILAVMSAIFAIAYGSLKNSGLQQGLNVSGFIAQLGRVDVFSCLNIAYIHTYIHTLFGVLY